MNVPTDLKYTASHEWVRSEPDGTITTGHHRSCAGGAGRPRLHRIARVGRTLKAGEACAVVESVKAASDVYAPVGGVVLAVNDAVVAAPEKVNADAYGNWLYRLKPAESGGRRPSCSTRPATSPPSANPDARRRPRTETMQMNELERGDSRGHAIAPRRCASSSSTEASSTGISAPTMPTRRRCCGTLGFASRARADRRDRPGGDTHAEAARAAGRRRARRKRWRTCARWRRRIASTPRTSARATTAPTRRA